MQVNDLLKSFYAFQHEHDKEIKRELELKRHKATSIKSLIEKYNEALAWMQKNEIKISPASRLIAYRKTLEEYADRRSNGESPSNLLNQKYVRAAFHETYIFINCFEFLRQSIAIDPTVVQVLTKATNGPISYTDESGDNGSARNFLFEIEASTKFYKSSSKFLFSENKQGDVNPKINLTLNRTVLNVNLMVECKRIQSRSQLLKRIKEAAKQADKRVKEISSNNTAYSMIFIDTTKILNRESKVEICQDDQSYNSAASKYLDDLSTYLDEYYSEIQPIFAKYPRLIGIEFQTRCLLIKPPFEIPTGAYSRIFTPRSDLDIYQDMILTEFQKSSEDSHVRF